MRVAGAQTVQTPSVLKTRDASVYVGHLAITGDRDDVFFYDRRDDSVLSTIAGGFYWTEHVKTEIELGLTTASRSNGVRFVDQAGVPSGFRAYTDIKTSRRIVTIGQTYQFLHNAWFHPFVTAGADLGWERRRTESPAQQYYGPATGSPPRVPPPIQIPAAPTVEETRFKPRFFGGTGFKAYLSERAFFRGEMRVGFGSEVHSALFRIGFGVDF